MTSGGRPRFLLPVIGKHVAVEFLRAKDDRISGIAGNLSTAQLISIGMVIFGVIWMRMRRDVTAAHPGIHTA